MRNIFTVLLLLMMAFTAIAQDGATINFYDPVDDADKSKVLVLASPHLGQYQGSFRPSALDSLITLFRYWQPAIIGVEAQPPKVISCQEQEGHDYVKVIQQFAGNITRYGHMAQAQLKISGNVARVKADSLLLATEDGYDVDEGTMIMHLLAAYDYYSALLQWAYLSKTQQADAYIPTDIRAHLDQALLSLDEINAIGIRIAMDSRLERLYQIDDHMDKDLFQDFADQLMDDISVTNAFDEVMQSTFYKDSEAKLQNAFMANNLLPYYRYLNSPEYLQTDYDTQWMMFFKANLSSGHDLSRIALWEARNMRIASHIREMTALYPGYKALIIIGASHKPFLDKYLSNFMDIKVVQLEEVYKEYLK
ncbi:MAG: DUF5694 domain-containing protein [Bacteroidota bacterium]|nr:DUF5694 domain-containing protein [Bacteroidota bacterium]